jgi:hypothetical protein
MEATATKYLELYRVTPAPGAPIPIPPHCLWQVHDNAPQAEEIAWHVRQLKTKKAPGTSGICPEDMQHWLELHKAGDNKQLFWLLTEIVQSAFLTGQLPQGLSVVMLVLLRKLGSSHFLGMGLLESMWKLILSTIETDRCCGVQQCSTRLPSGERHWDSGSLQQAEWAACGCKERHHSAYIPQSDQGVQHPGQGMQTRVFTGLQCWQEHYLDFGNLLDMA